MLGGKSPFHRVPEHDDESGVGLQGVDEVLDEEGRLSLAGVVVEVHPGVVVPHGGRAGFSCQNQMYTQRPVFTVSLTHLMCVVIIVNFMYFPLYIIITNE